MSPKFTTRLRFASFRSVAPLLLFAGGCNLILGGALFFALNAVFGPTVAGLASSALFVVIFIAFVILATRKNNTLTLDGNIMRVKTTLWKHRYDLVKQPFSIGYWSVATGQPSHQVASGAVAIVPTKNGTVTVGGVGASVIDEFNAMLGPRLTLGPRWVCATEDDFRRLVATLRDGA